MYTVYNMQTATAEPLRIDRRNISEAVAAAVREMIVSGALEPGARVNEVQLAARLGVSRTPLREALGRLVAEGALRSVPRSGTYVLELTVEEVDQLYLVRALLDPAALELAGIPPARQLARLSALNREIGRERDPERVIELDDRWHLELLAGCPNRVLIELIQQFMQRTRRYELALMRVKQNVQRATADHARILRLLRAGDLAGACAALRRNMQSGVEPIRAWLRDREGRRA